MSETAQTNRLEGILEKIVYQDRSSGWGVARLVLDPSRSLVTVTGPIFGLQEGERVQVQGRWVSRDPYGRQFQIDSYVHVRPRTIKGIQEYLSSGFIKGIGKDTSKKLVDAFGPDIISIIENDPDKLVQVQGIGRKKAGMIHSAWKKHHEMADIMIFLQSLEIPTAYAYRIFKFYGKDAVRIIQDNPYRLCRDIVGIGFRTADKIALKFGIPRESTGRAKAGVVFSLGEFAEKGNVCCPIDMVVSKASKILEIPELRIRDTLEALNLEEEIKIVDFSGRKLVYLKSLYEIEEAITLYLKNLMDTHRLKAVEDILPDVKRFENACSIQLAQEQRDALTCALREKVMVITGGPGTGKTTLIRGIIDICERKGLEVELCAPTGRAAKRMSEATGREAMTIHRLFELYPAEKESPEVFTRRLRTDMLIIDETSMMDAVLFSKVLKGIGPDTSLILVGDSDQLPSVGPGNVLKDIISSGSVKTVRLTTIFRQASRSLIVTNAHRINQGLLPHMRGLEGEEDFFFIRRDNPEEALEVIKELVVNRIPKRFGFDPIKDIQVLSPMHKGTLGVENLNRELQLILNPEGKTLIHGSRRFIDGDKVMQLRNNYDHGIFNGDMGTVQFVDPDKGIMDVDFEDRIIRYEGPDMDDVAPAYACSIHKSQGNEYPAVVLVMHMQHGIMLERNLLYTGLTRGRSLVIVVGSARAVEMATANISKTRRCTLLAERLKGLI